MNIDEKTFGWILSAVIEATSQDPSRVSKIIDAATKGVKDFAHNERSTSNCLANMLISEVLDKTSFFSDEQRMAALYRYFGSAPIFADITKHYGVSSDWKPDEKLIDSIFPKN